MAAAVVDDDRMISGCLVEVVAGQRPIELRVVEHEARDPQPRRARLRLLVDGVEKLGHRADVAVDAVELVDAARVRHVRQHFPRLDLRILEDIGDRIDGAARHAGLVERGD